MKTFGFKTRKEFEEAVVRAVKGSDEMQRELMGKPTRYKMSRFEDEELKPTEPQTNTTNKIEISNKLVDDNDSTTSAKNAQLCSEGCSHTVQCLYRAREYLIHKEGITLC